MNISGGSALLLIFSVSAICIRAFPENITNNNRKEYTFLWLIENYSYSWHQNRELLKSPEFTADGLEGTVWYLVLYPRGDRNEFKGHVSLFLMRNGIDDGPAYFPVKYELSIMAADGSALNSSEIEWTFRRGEGYGHGRIAQVDDVLLHRKDDLLPQDTLSVRCRIWTGEGNVQKVKQIVARTRIGIEHISFLHVVEDFSALLPNHIKIVEIGSPSKKEPALSSSLHFSDDSVCGGKIILKITPSGDNRILSRCKLSLLDASGHLVQAGEADNRFGDTRKDITKLPLSLTRQVILDRKSEFLPDDKLSLLWQGIFSTGIEYERIESILHEIPFVVSKHVKDDNQNKDKYKTAEKLSACSSALDDFKTIYDNQFLTDVELETKTRSFTAHKIVLCARSAVFNATLTNNTTNGVIHVDDLEDDTVQQLLLFLYSDKLENLDWESAMKLYRAANKYKIEKLKVMSSSYLIDNLNISSASEVLLLADNHNDSDLKFAVEDFIFKNEEQVFLSEEWRKLIETNPVLVSKTMLLKYMKKF